MDLSSDNPLWPALDGRPRSYPPPSGDLRTEVVVVGGGITGALVAHGLVSAGWDAILLDKRDIGRGSTAASTALLQYELDRPLHELRTLRGREDADRVYLACRDAIDELAEQAATLRESVGFTRRESLYLVSRERDLDVHREELAARRKLGLDAEWIDRDGLRRNYGIDRPGGICSAPAAEVDPYALTHVLVDEARSRGLRVFGRTRVAQVKARNDGATLLLAEGCRVSSRYVVFATGYETREFVGVGDARLVSTFAVSSVPGAVPSPWRASGALIWERADPYLYLRTTADGRVIVGGEDEDFRDPEHRDALLSAKAERLARRFRELFPDSELEVERAWAGTFGETADGLPYIGAHEEWPSCQFALGYGGNGIVFSVLAAQIIRDAIGGQTHPLALLFRFGR